jgi:hypothetical protein
MRAIRMCFGLVVLLLVAGRMFGQAGATGTILGTVTDSTGAIVPNVNVTVTNVGTNSAFRTTTTSSGDFNAPALNPGTYSVTAEAKGFQKSVTTGFSLAVNQKVRIDLVMKPGAVTETLEVTAQAVALDTDSSGLSQLVSQQQVQELPLNGRNFMQLLMVSAGAVTVGGEQGTMRQGSGNAISVNGGRPEGNNYTLDGLVNTDSALVTPAVILSQDAIQEFKVESGTYSAEYGFSATQVNIVSRGGTNKLHGSVFEFNRNDAYDAKPFPTVSDYNASRITSLPVLRQNQFGFVADGPVYIPKLYNGRDKSFWMANYEGWRINNGGVARETVPNPAVLTGDFSGETYPALGSKTITVNGSPVVVNLPGGPLPAYGTTTCSALLVAGYNCMPVDPTTGQPFAGNKILLSSLTSRLGKVALANGLWAAPTIAYQPEGVTNFIKNMGFPLSTNQQTYRADQNLGKLGSVFFRFTYAKFTNSGTYNSGDLVHGLEHWYQNQKSWEVSHTISIGNANVNNFRFGYLKADAPQGGDPVPSAVVSALGLTGTFTTFSALQQTWPNVGMTTYSSGGGSVNSYSGSSQPAWEYADSFSMIRGKHTIGLGIDYRRWQLIRNLDDDFYGDWGFNSNLVSTNTPGCPNAPVTYTLNGNTTTQSLCGTGNAVADLMMGYYNNVGGFVPGPLSPTTTAGNEQTHVFSYLAPYAMDDFKVTQKLTLNLGLRWDFHAAAYEASNHFFWLDTQNPAGGLCYADPKLTSNGVAPGVGLDGKGILRYCGSVPHPGSKNPFAPRFGFAYRLTDKTVVRGGYGIFFDSAEGREIDNSADIYPYSIRNNLTPGTVSTLPKFSNQLFPSYSTLGPFPQSTLSFIAVIESENPLNPYVQSWTAGVQRELARSTTLEVNYIGTHAVHLLDRRNISQPNGISATDLPFCQTNPQDTTHNCPVKYRLPYQNFNGFYINSDWHGYSHYNAMNIKFEHRTNDLAVTSIFTWAASKDDKSAAAGVGATGSGYQGTMDNHHPQLDYGPSDFNVDHRFVSSYVYQLPIGRGKKFAGNVSRAGDLAIGGWEVTGITTFQTGFPFSIAANDINGLLDSQFQRASYTAGCGIHSNLTQQFQRINMSCFTQPLSGVYGNTTRNFLRQPGINNWDMGFSKNLHLTERMNFKISVDTFNTFNHHQYAGDVGGLATGGSGGNNTISNNVNNSNIVAGKITGASASRIVQLSGKFSF